MVPSLLVVDDMPDAVRSVARLAKRHTPKGTLIETASNGRELVEKVRSAEYALILTDYRMPEMNGIDAIREIRTFNTIVPIYVLSTDPVKNKAFEAGANGFYDKVDNFLPDLIRIIKQYF